MLHECKIFHKQVKLPNFIFRWVSVLLTNGLSLSSRFTLNACSVKWIWPFPYLFSLPADKGSLSVERDIEIWEAGNQNWASWFRCAHLVSVFGVHGFLRDLGLQWLQLPGCLVLQGIAPGSTKWPAVNSGTLIWAVLQQCLQPMSLVLTSSPELQGSQKDPMAGTPLGTSICSGL